MVYAPAVSQFAGKNAFAGWPQHQGNFVFFRAYVGKDGQPAPYRSDNIPFAPPAFLKISAKGVQAAEWVMVAGYPARTYRHLTAAELKRQFTQILPLAQQYRAEAIKVMQQVTAEHSAERQRYQPVLTSLIQRHHNTAALIPDLSKQRFATAKEQQQQALLQWIKAEPGSPSSFFAGIA